jgi:hypothetical protein
MLIAIYALYLVACSSITGLFGFFVGRCARKLPIIDNNLPWTMSRSQAPIAIEDGRPTLYPPRWPHDSNAE